MANSDYSTRGLTLSFCPRALTEIALEHLDTSVQVVSYTSPSTADIRAGSAAFIGDEIVKVTGYANGPKIDISYTYRITTSNTTGNGVHTESIDPPGPSFWFTTGQEFDISPTDPSYEYEFVIDAKYETNPEVPSYNTLVYGVDYEIDPDWTFRILRNLNTFLVPIVVRAQYKVVDVTNTDTPVVVSIDGQNSGTTYTLNLYGGSLQAFTYIRYTLPFGGGNVNLVSGTDYSRSGNVITFLNDFRALSQRKYMQITRGCCDTIPQPHAIGTEVWFFDDFLARDNVEYAPTETISVKPLPKTAAGGPVPLASSPPEEITFNWRFARPYPPGLLKVNTADWFDGFTLASGGVEELAFTWAHRNRVTQMDTLVDYTAGSITPEASTTYRAKVYDATDTLIATHDALTGTSWSYTLAQMNTDFGSPTPGTTNAYVVFCSVRDSLESWQQYRVDFTF